MMFHLSVSKTIQAIGVLFRKDGVERMNYMRLLKLLYIADRESMKETGRPIIGGPVMAMERGPILEEVYDLIRGQHRQMPTWAKFFRTDHYNLELLDQPDVGELSKYEIRKLQEVAQRHENDDEWELSRVTHSFEEWRKNDPGTSSKSIPLQDILEAVGHNGAIKDILEEARDREHYRRIFGNRQSALPNRRPLAYQ